MPNNPQNPRIGLTCNAVGGSQILTIGGRDGNPKVVDSTHIVNIQSTYGIQDPNAQGLAIFDMTNLTFRPNTRLGHQRMSSLASLSSSTQRRSSKSKKPSPFVYSDFLTAKQNLQSESYSRCRSTINSHALHEQYVPKSVPQSLSRLRLY